MRNFQSPKIHNSKNPFLNPVILRLTIEQSFVAQPIGERHLVPMNFFCFHMDHSGHILLLDKIVFLILFFQTR